MSNRLRRIVAVMAAALLLSSVFATSAIADTHDTHSAQIEADAANAPAALDGLLLRPAGFVGLVLGTGLFLAVTPIVLITRPHEIAKPFEALVARPARFLWQDPLGGH